MFTDGFDMVLIGIGEEFENNPYALEAYNRLAERTEGKNSFFITLCMDDVIFQSNIPGDRIVAPLGGKRNKQCPDACENRLFELSDTVCPICGKSLIYNNIMAENYVENGYLPMWEKYMKWLTGTLNKKLLVVELGVSFKFPQIIRFAFEKVVMLNNKAHFIRVHEKLSQLTPEISDKGEGIKANSVKWIIEN